MSFDYKVSASILAASGALTSRGFGTVIYCSRTASFGAVNTIRSYRNITEVNADSDLSTQDKAVAAAFFGQALSPSPLLIAQCAAAAAQDIKFTIGGTVASGEDFSITVNGITSTFTSASTSTSDVAAGLIAALTTDLAAEDVTVGGSGDDVTVAADNAGEAFTYSLSTDSTLGTITESVTQANVSFGTSLAELRLLNSDFYGILIEAQTDIELMATAVFAEADGFALFSGQSTSAAAKSGATTGNILKDLKDGSYKQTFISINDDATEYISAAALAMGLMPGPDVASSAWSLMTLTGITPDELTSAEQTAVAAQNGNYYSTFMGANSWGDGVSSEGTSLTNVITEDWYKTRVVEDAAATLKKVVDLGGKIPYTDAGIAQVAQSVRTIQERGAALRFPHFARLDNGKVDGSIDIPRAADATPAEKAAGTITIPSSVTLAGEIKEITFTLTVET